MTLMNMPTASNVSLKENSKITFVLQLPGCGWEAQGRLCFASRPMLTVDAHFTQLRSKPRELGSSGGK